MPKLPRLTAREIAAALDLSLSLVSHHMRILREAGFIETERDSGDARWCYYMIVLQALTDFRSELANLLDTARIQPRQPSCGPGGCER